MISVIVEALFAPIIVTVEAVVVAIVESLVAIIDF